MQVNSNHISNNKRTSPFPSFLLSYIHKPFFSSLFVLLKPVSTENFKLPVANVLRRKDSSSLALLQSSDMLKPTAAAIFNLHSKVNVKISGTQLDMYPDLWELESKKLADRERGYITPQITEAARKLWCKLNFHSSLLDCTAGEEEKRNYSSIWGSPLLFLVEQEQLSCALVHSTAMFSPEPLQNQWEQWLTIYANASNWVAGVFRVIRCQFTTDVRLK